MKSLKFKVFTLLIFNLQLLTGPLSAELGLLTERDFVCHGQKGRFVRVQGKKYTDCAGGHLPGGGIDERLLRLLNAFQSAVQKSVVVTSGYRCQPHNLYSWAFVVKETGREDGVSLQSLHCAGAAADFYVKTVRDLEEYKKYETFLRLLANKEPGFDRNQPSVWTAVYDSRDVRDPDNRHDDPYIHVHATDVERRALEPVPFQEKE